MVVESKQTLDVGEDSLWYKKRHHLRGARPVLLRQRRRDFRGLTAKLDYLQDLGITAIWLLPFFPSPLKDDRYDISDYTGVHPSYGTPRAFRAFLREANRRSIRVIVELVVNHTSDQHPWFQRARKCALGEPLAQFLRVERHGEQVSGRTHHLPGLRVLQLGLGPGGQGLLLASVLLPPARPKLRQSRGEAGHSEGGRCPAKDAGLGPTPGRGAIPV